MLFLTCGERRHFRVNGDRPFNGPLASKVGKAMKLTIFLLTAALIQVSAKGFSQNLTLDFKDASIEKVFKEIERQTGFGFLYTKKVLLDVPKVDIHVKNAPLREVLQYCLKGQSLEFSIQNNTIIISRKAVPVTASALHAISMAAIPVSGRVTDEQGRPIASVSVVIPGSPLGGMTNEKGEYSIANVPDDANLFFSYIGYQSQTIPIKNKTVINIVLKMEVRQLDETVIIGYGTTSRRKSTGSISSVTTEEISRQPVENPLLAMEGRIAGAEIIQSNGLPGSTVSIQIRGINSISNGTVPLYIIDGVPFNIQDQSVPASNNLNSFGIYAANGGISPFSMINPSDIERIDVLKDADATSIYGTRGANGVILITTKKGKSGKTRLDFNVYRGWGTVPRFVKMMNLNQYLTMRKEALANDGLTSDPGFAPDLTTWSQTTPTADWQKKYLGGTSGITDAQASLSGGDARTHFMLAGSYHKETTVYPGDWGSQRISARFNADHYSADRNFFASVSTIYSYNKANLPSTDLASAVYNLPPNLPLYNPDGSLFWDPNYTNPESYALQKYFGKINNLVSSIQLRYTLFPGLDIKTSFGFNSISTDQNQQLPALSQNPSFGTTLNKASFATMNQQGYIVEPQIVYTKMFGKGKLTALLGGDA